MTDRRKIHFRNGSTGFGWKSFTAELVSNGCDAGYECMAQALAESGEGKAKSVTEAMKKYGIDPAKPDPSTV